MFIITARCCYYHGLLSVADLTSTPHDSTTGNTVARDKSIQSTHSSTLVSQQTQLQGELTIIKSKLSAFETTKKAIEAKLKLVRIARALQLYSESGDGWIMYTPLVEDTPKFGMAGSVICPPECKLGNFKLHISVSKTSMLTAIPLVFQTCHKYFQQNFGLKFVSESQFAGRYQRGKQFALFVTAEIEEKKSHEFRQFVSSLHQTFLTHRIQPDEGLVLTIATVDEIKKVEYRTSLEYGNLQTRKYDRAIPGTPFFYYRNDRGVPIDDKETWAVEEREIDITAWSAGHMRLYTEIDTVIKSRPQSAHNFLNDFDPFDDFSIAPTW